MNTSLDAYTETDHQVWVQAPTGGLYLYRGGLIYAVARSWAAAWNQQAPADVAPGSVFLAVAATTTFEEVK